MSGRGEPEFASSSTVRFWRLTFDAAFDDKRLSERIGGREVLIYTFDQSGPHPYPHLIDFTDQDEARDACAVASFGEMAHGSVTNIRVTTWLERREFSAPVEVDPAWLATRGGRGTAPDLKADA